MPRALFDEVIGPVVRGPLVEVLNNVIAPVLAVAGEVSVLSHNGDRRIKLFCSEPVGMTKEADELDALPTSSLVVDPCKLFAVVMEPVIPAVPSPHVTAPTFVIEALRSQILLKTT